MMEVCHGVVVPEEPLVLPREFSRRILAVSFSTTLCATLAILSRRRDFIVISLGMMTTSLLYWRRPVKGLRRNVDICWVAFSFSYQAWRSIVELRGGRLAAYWSLSGGIVLCYGCAKRHGQRSDFDSSSRWHSGIHLLGNVANCVLYTSGENFGAVWLDPIRWGRCFVFWCAVAMLYHALLCAPTPEAKDYRRLPNRVLI